MSGLYDNLDNKEIEKGFLVYSVERDGKQGVSEDQYRRLRGMQLSCRAGIFDAC